MDDTIAYSLLVFAKTPKGVAEINARSGALTLQARRVLIMIDGRRPVAELMAVVRTGEFDGIMAALEQQGMIDKVDTAAPPPRNYEEEDFADTISLLQENATALRALPHVNPADVAKAAAQERPATIGQAANRQVEATDDAAAIAARAVANASAAHPMEPAMRRPPTISVPAPTTQTPGAAGAARPGTINTRVPEPVRQAPRPATISVPQPLPAASAGGAAAPARAEAAHAPAPAVVTTANTPARSLEEEKRFLVSELYSILGPYGEQSAAKLMECTTMEALREQVKQAGKRVATFRGEKAAQDYLRSVGYA